MAFAQKNGNNWTPGYRVEGKKVYCTAKVCGTFTTKPEAEAHAAECEAKAQEIVNLERQWVLSNPNPLAHELSPAQKAKLTFEDTWDRYRSGIGCTIELATLETYAASIKLRILPQFRTKRPDDISKGLVGTFLSALKNKGESPATIRATLLAFSSVMSYAMEQEIRTRLDNPCHGHKIEKVVREKREEDFELTGEQVQRLVEAFDTPGLKLVTLTLVGTGCRYEELAALRVGCLDVKRNTIFIERRTTWPTKNEERNHHGGPLEHPNTKSKGVRKFQIRPHLALQLDQWIKDNDLKRGQLLFPYDLVLPETWGRRFIDDTDIPELTEEFTATLGTIEAPNGYAYRHGTIGGAVNAKCKCEYCLTARRRYDRARHLTKGRKPVGERAILANPEKSMAHKLYLTRFHKAVKASGLDEELDWKPTPHCLRHTYITRLANSGVPLAEVQRRAGHQDIQTTMGYVHPNKAADKAAVEALGDDFDIELEG
jgi:integrase